MQSWDLDARPEQDGGDKVGYTSFPEGITRIRIVDNAPYMRWTHWMQKYQRSVTCPGKGCPICEIRKREKENGIKNQSYAVAKRFTIHILNRETNNLEIMEQGKTFFEDLKLLMGDLQKEGKTLIDADIKVRRTGMDKDNTRYRIDLDEKYPLSDADKAQLERRIDFREYYKPQSPEQIMQLIEFQPSQEKKALDFWIEITSGNTPTQASAQNKDEGDEPIEIS